MERLQSTVAKKIRLQGIGLHSGKACVLEILPAGAGTGIVFQRTDIPGSASIAAHPANITSTDLSTTISNGDVSVSTVEHLMAAFAGLEIDNAHVRIDGPEIPIMDGSSAPFVDAFVAVGIRRLSKSRKVYFLKKEIEITEGDRSVKLTPSDQLEFACNISYTSQAIGNQSISIDFNVRRFLELCNARTFCHIAEVDAMRDAGLALGGSLENAVVVNDSSVINEDGLRGSDEFVRHKLLDAVGDFALLGHTLIARIELNKSGHGLHSKLLKKLWENKEEYLTSVDLGAFESDKKPALPERVAAVAAAAALPG